MALTKSVVAVASGVTTTSTTTGVSIATAYRATLGVSVVVVGTPTVAASLIVQVSLDGGTDYYDHIGPISPGALTAATYQIFLTATDAAGNTNSGAANAAFTFTIQAEGSATGGSENDYLTGGSGNDTAS